MLVLATAGANRLSTSQKKQPACYAMNTGTEVDPADVLRLIHSHVCQQEWRQTTQEELVITKIANGFINRNYVIERKDGQKLLLKLYGGNVGADEDEVTLSIEHEILTCATWSRIGGGPKLQAVFPGGRIEEFIESHTITMAEFQEAGIRKQLAKAIATFHSLELPFQKPAFDYHHLLTRMYREFEVNNTKEDIVRNPFFAAKNVDVSAVSNYDYASDLKWLKEALKEEHHRMVYTHGDLHGHNIIIRSDNGKPVLIDFQESGYNWRARDLGLYLISSVTDLDDMTAASPFPSEESCFMFLNDYMEQIQELALFQDIDRNGKDSNEHLMMEALVGGMVSTMYIILLIMNRHKTMVTASSGLSAVS